MWPATSPGGDFVAFSALGSHLAHVRPSGVNKSGPQLFELCSLIGSETISSKLNMNSRPMCNMQNSFICCGSQKELPKADCPNSSP